MPRYVKTPSCRWAPQSSLDGHKLCVVCVVFLIKRNGVIFTLSVTKGLERREIVG